MESRQGTGRVWGITREEEEKQLAEILSTADENLRKTEYRIRQLAEELYDLMETYGPKDKEALSLLHNTQSQLEESKRDRIRCEKARKKPYFGRIDFTDEKIRREESYYVGRVGITRNGQDPLVIDWRAPVASVYYENMLGPCSYVVKQEGVCRIQLNRKRTYEIEDGRLKDFYDSDVVANDELLSKYLARNKRAVLGEIIATIQKEQNEIIRKSPKTNLIVQGVAGSGKTTVAMHRISYILYNYEEFRPEDFYIIGSNRILLNYITGVLPDLDVYGVSQMTMEQLFVRLLYEEWDPGTCRICPVDKNDSRIQRKGSTSWFRELESFCERYEQSQIPVREVKLEKNGKLLLDEKTIREYISASSRLSMQSKICFLNEMLKDRLENELCGKYVSYTQEEKKELQRKYRWHFGKAEWKGSVFQLYRQFLEEQNEKGRCTVIREQEWDVYDLAALAYLYKRIRETDGIREASHIIIDEAQDYGMMAYRALAYCLRGCTYTIMGDVSQNIHYGYGLNDWEELRELILTGTFDSFELLKRSYRNTVEISQFATDILRHGNFPIYPVDPVIRHGKEAQLYRCRDKEAMIRKTIRVIREWQKDGRETIAVICRDAEEAGDVAELLSRELRLEDTDPETAEFGSGIMVLPVEYTKGLEFDAVAIYNPSREQYPEEDAYVKLLYVAATRALHELAVIHRGDLTGLVGNPVPEAKRMQSLEGSESRPFRFAGKKELTGREQMIQDVIQGNRERELRNYMGPRPLNVSVPGRTVSAGISTVPPRQTNGAVPDPVPVNPSSRSFLSVPSNDELRPGGHGRIRQEIRIVKRNKQLAELTSSYGTLQLIPVDDRILRIRFRKGSLVPFASGYWDCMPETPVNWKAKEGKSLVEISTDSMVVRIEKRTGAMQFLDARGRLLTGEKKELPRRVEETPVCKTWTYFDWGKQEKLWVKGMLEDDFHRIDRKARYISFGGKKLRMPLLISEAGYGIAVACPHTVLCCAIPMYGPYIATEGEAQIDYYFLYGENREGIMDLYRKILKKKQQGG